MLQGPPLTTNISTSAAMHSNTGCAPIVASRAAPRGKHNEYACSGVRRCCGGRWHSRTNGGCQGQGAGSQPESTGAGKGQRQAQRRDFDGHGRTEQRGDSGPRDARTVHAGNHHRQRRHCRSGSRLCVREAQFHDHRAAPPLGREVRKGRHRRLCGQESPSHGLVCAADARGSRHQESAVPPVEARADCPHQPHCRHAAPDRCTRARLRGARFRLPHGGFLRSTRKSR
jgi:hypothetical protein